MTLPSLLAKKQHPCLRRKRPTPASHEVTHRYALDFGLSTNHAFSIKTPHWPLERVKELAAKPNGLFVQIGRAAKFFPTRREALDSARLIIASLTSAQFAHSVQLTFDIADVYGVSFNDGGWYLKLTIDESIPEVAVISFHPLEQPLQTNKGIVKP